MKKKAVVLILLLAVLLGALSSSTYALEKGEGNGEGSNSVAALAYSSEPSNLYLFIYNGQHPFASEEFVTDNCDLSMLYVYNSETESLSRISDRTVVAYTATKEGVFFVTEDGQIVYSDYQGTNEEVVGSVQGSIASFDYFDGSLCYVENGEKIVFVDVQTGARTAAFTADCIVSVYQFDHDKLIWRDADDTPFYLNTTTGENTALESEMEVNCLMAPYITPASASGGTNSRSAADLSINDVTFPLPGYDAPTPGTNKNYTTAVSYFINSTNNTAPTCDHSNDICNSIKYGNHTQCFGFAIYAHDNYLHIYSESKIGDQSGVANPEGWAAGDFVQTATIENGEVDVMPGYELNSTSAVKAFFESLQPGAYVRYGKYSDSTPSNGVHSIVVVSIEENGFWAYECNQDNKCGVHLWYYTYSYLHSRYNYIHNYVNHTFGEMEYVSETIHTNGCVNCDGYLRQPHTDILDPVVKDKTYHTIRYECCDHEETEEHTGSASYLPYWISQHKTYYGCCDDPYFEPHTVDGVYSYVSEEKHSVYFSCCNGLHEESHTGTSSFVCQNTRWHKKVYSCCGGSALSNHSAPAQYLRYTEDEHKVTYNCCTGFTTAPHTYTSGTNPVCTGCGKPKIQIVGKMQKTDPQGLVQEQTE